MVIAIYLSSHGSSPANLRLVFILNTRQSSNDALQSHAYNTKEVVSPTTNLKDHICRGISPQFVLKTYAKVYCHIMNTVQSSLH